MTDDVDRAQDQADAFIASALHRTLAALPAADAPAAAQCEACAKPIPERRRQLVPGALRCTACQHAIERGMGR